MSDNKETVSLDQLASMNTAATTVANTNINNDQVVSVSDPSISPISAINSAAPLKTQYAPKNIEDIRKFEEPVNPVEVNMNAYYSKIDAALDRTKVEIYDTAMEKAIKKIEEQEDLVDGAPIPYVSPIDSILSTDNAADKEEEDIFEGSDNSQKNATTYVQKVEEDVAVTKVAAAVTELKVNEETAASHKDMFKFVDVDLDEDEEIEAEDPLEEERQKKELDELKEEIKKSIVPIKNAVDLTTFTIAKKTMNLSRLLSNTAVTQRKVADWVMYSQKKAISMSAVSGPEIEKMNPKNGRNRLNTYKDIYNIFYSHLEDQNKPSSLEAWVKNINFYDIDHLYFLAYKACFCNDNFLTYTCPKCNKVHIQKVDINDMVKYDSDEVKEEVAKLLAGDSTSKGTDYTAQIIQVSDSIAISFRVPTVYSVIFETSSLSEALSNKYADILGVISYIDAIYFINKEDGTLQEIDTQADPTDFAKSVKRKIKIYSDIIALLSSDQYLVILTEMKKLNDSNDKIKYIMPAITCPKCEATIEEMVVDPLDMLFSRHQLVAIQNI